MYWIIGIIGFCFVVLPFLFGYAENGIALWMSVILGIVVMIAAFLEGTDTKKSHWEYWLTVVIGLGAMVAPFVLGFGSASVATWSSVGIGFLLALLSGSKLYYDQPSIR